MEKYTKVINKKTGLCNVATGTDAEYYESIGMTLQDVEQSEIDGNWYLTAKCPHYTDAEKFKIAKAEKIGENDTKASEARYNQEFTLTVQKKVCLFDTSEQTQRDLLTAFAVCSTGATYDGWVTNNGVELDLTLEDVALISATFKEKSNIYGKWNRYKQAIDDAKTVAEIEAIVIDYEVSNDNDI